MIDIERIQQDGYQLMSGVDYCDLEHMASGLGRIQPDLRTKERIRVISPQLSENAPSSTLSQQYGMAAFPLHSETAFLRMPVRYLLLFCIDPGHEKRPTQWMDCKALTDHNTLWEDQWVVRRNREPFLSSILTRTTAGWMIRFDPECMQPSHQNCGSAQIMNDLVSKNEALAHSWGAGDLLLLDNHRVLHGRGSASTPDPDRKLVRILIE